jgi:hypothetical protein
MCKNAFIVVIALTQNLMFTNVGFYVTGSLSSPLSLSSEASHNWSCFELVLQRGQEAVASPRIDVPLRGHLREVIRESSVLKMIIF